MRPTAAEDLRRCAGHEQPAAPGDPLHGCEHEQQQRLGKGVHPEPRHVELALSDDLRQERCHDDDQQPREVEVHERPVDPAEVPEHPVVGPPVRPDDQEADHERQVGERILGEGGEQFGSGRALGDGQLDRQQCDRDGDDGVGEEHQTLGRAPGDVARLARRRLRRRRCRSRRRAPLRPPRREGRGRRSSVTTLNPVARVADTSVTSVGPVPEGCPISMSESTDVASTDVASTDIASTDAVSTDAGALLEPEALDDAVAAARKAFDAATDLAALAAAKPAHLGDRAPVLLARRALGSLPGPQRADAGTAGERGAHPGAGGVRRPSRAARGRTRRAGARRGGRRRHPSRSTARRAAPGTRSRRSASASPTCSSRWATRSPRGPRPSRRG